MKQKMVAAVDIGSSKICSLLANVDAEDAIQIVGIGVTPSAGINKGLVTDIDQASESIRQSVRRAEQTSGESIDSVFLGISASNISSTSNCASISVGSKPRTVRQVDVDRVLKVARQIKIPQGRNILHMIPHTFGIDTQIGVKDPKGLTAFRIDLDTHIVTIPQSSAENITKCAHKAGLNIEGLVLQCLASAQSVLHPDETDAGVVLADIGAGTTGISAYKNGNLVLTAVLPVGGNQITRDLSVGLGIPVETAEQLKKEHCDLAEKEDPDAKEEPSVQVHLDGVMKIYRKDINDIIKARVDEMIKLIVAHLMQQTQSQNYLAYMSEFTAGLVLTGGTANLGGIRAVAQDITGLPTRIGIPPAMSGLADQQLQDSAYASSVGILLCSGKNYRQEQSWIRSETGIKNKVVDRVKSVRQLVPWGSPKY